MIEPRPYQIQAANYALKTRQAVCSLPTGTSKTLVAVLWLKSLFEAGEAKRALILEQTGLLVNQSSDYFFYKADVECVSIDGRIPRPRRAKLWQSEVVVATPETTFNNIKFVHFDAVVVDECHHNEMADPLQVRMEGKCFTDRKFGGKFKLESYLSVAPAIFTSIKEYLDLGLIMSISR